MVVPRNLMEIPLMSLVEIFCFFSTGHIARVLTGKVMREEKN
jgi:hypothetical protein